VGELQKSKGGNPYTRDRLEEMLDFLTTSSVLFEELVHLPTATLKGMVRLRGKLRTMVGASRNLTKRASGEDDAKR
jgi:hypothetical protein